MRKNILGIIPARAGSQRVPKKNLRLLGGTPLVARAIESALEAKTLDRVMVSSDDKEVLLQIVGPFDYTIGAEAEITKLQMLSSGQYVSGRAEGSFFNPFANAEVFGILEFENLHIDTDEENTIYSNLRRGSNGT